MESPARLTALHPRPQQPPPGLEPTLRNEPSPPVCETTARCGNAWQRGEGESSAGDKIASFRVQSIRHRATGGRPGGRVGGGVVGRWVGEGGERGENKNDPQTHKTKEQSPSFRTTSRRPERCPAAALPAGRAALREALRDGAAWPPARGRVRGAGGDPWARSYSPREKAKKTDPLEGIYT